MSRWGRTHWGQKGGKANMKKVGGGLVQIGTILGQAVREASQSTKDFNARLEQMKKLSAPRGPWKPKSGSTRLGNGLPEPWLVKTQMVKAGRFKCQYVVTDPGISPCGEPAARACQVCYAAICENHCSYHPVAHWNIKDRDVPLGLCPSCFVQIIRRILLTDTDQTYNAFRQDMTKKWEAQMGVMTP